MPQLFFSTQKKKKKKGAALTLRRLTAISFTEQTSWAGYLNVVYFRRSLTCTLGLTNDLIDGGQPRTKARKAKPNHVLKTGFTPRLATVYQVVRYPKSS